MQTLEKHIQELRARVLWILAFFGGSTALSFYYSKNILSFLQTDLNVALHALTAYETFYTQLMIAMVVGFFLSLPVVLYQLLKFSEPGLKPREYKLLRNYLPFSVLLFGIGAVFSYQYVVKTSLSFFQASTVATDVTSVWGLKSTLGFAMKLSGFTGVVFQLPIIAVILAKTGLINKNMMVKYRSYFIIGILLCAALATPPDILTQILVTVPVIGLYQLSIFLVGTLEK